MTFARRLIGNAPPRTLWLLAILLALLLVAPIVLGKYWLSVLILVLYFAYVGQAWNILMGFAGQLSLGHALYAGLGGYIAAGLFFHYGIGPWAGVFAAAATAALAGAIVGYLGFRFSLAGVYFALLTIAFSEFTRLAFDHWEWAGGAGGLFLKVDGGSDIMNLRGGPLLFYYVILALAAFAFILCRALLESRLGRYWLAIREDAEAAQAVGVPVLRCKMIAIVISATLTALAGVWNAFYYNNLFPETAFAVGRSIEITLAPIIGGLGTLFGPVVGAVVLAGLGEAFTDLGETLGIPGIKQIFYGLALLVIVIYRPAGVWPWLAAKLGLAERTEVSGARLELVGIGKSFRGLRAVHDVSFSVPAGAIHALIGPNGAGKTTIFNMIAGALAPDAGTVTLDGKVISGLRPDRACDAGIGRTFQLVKPFKGLSVLENVTVGALHRQHDLARARDHASAILSRLGLHDRRHQLAESLTLPDRKRLEVARALATGPKLLLLDEVMAGLRPTEVDVMVAFLRELNAQSGLTILLIEHVMRAVMALAAEVVVVSYGEKIAEGTPQTIARHQAVLDVYLGEAEEP